jgi:hypothetical protein
MQQIPLDVQFEAKTEAELARVQVVLRSASLDRAMLAMGGALRKGLYSTFLAGLAVACSTGLASLRAIATYISPSFEISDM